MQTEAKYHEQQRIHLASYVKDMGIADESVLQAMKTVPRHLFFLNGKAFFNKVIYENVPVHIGMGQTISRPYVAAYQAEALQIGPDDKVLEIGTGSGYLAALLCEMGAQVYTIERIQTLAQRAEHMLNELGYSKVHCYWKDGFTGLEDKAPFDKIIITVYVTEIPNALLKQLKIGAEMIFPLGNENHSSIFRIIRKMEDKYETTELPGSFRFGPIIRGTKP